MLSSVVKSLGFALLVTAGIVSAQSASTSGYVGYNVSLEGDQDSVVFSTEETRPDAEYTEPNPDVFLNATVDVGEIDIVVDNLTAKVNLDAQVLSLLDFNAGVTVSISEVNLLIENVTAKVLLEARLQNLVTMISDVLDSIDLNPVIATLGQDVSSVVNSTTSALGSTVSSATSALSRRSFELQYNILYSINDYSGNTHTNRVLAQNGDIVDEYVDNDGNAHGQKVIGTYASDMTFNGYEATTEFDGQTVTEREYTYSPYHGIMAISAVYTNADGAVVGTQILAESNAGGSSTITDL